MMTRNNNSALRNGAHVEIHGLQNSTHLNGKRGRLKTFHREGAHAGRWAVRVADGGGGESQHAIKPENLRLVVVEPPQPQQAARPAIQASAGRPSRDIRSNNRTHRNNTGPAIIQAVPMGRASGAVLTNPKNDAWANGLSVEDQYEWLSNCYQMRCDDDYVYGGCNLHGPYNPEASPESITSDFMTFCLLAKRSKCIPAGGWQWQEFLRKAAGFVVFAFEKSDAKERWGSENVFSAMMGGRSLRYTAELVYGSSCQEQSDSPQAERAMQEASEHPSDAIYNEIGGRNAWTMFQQELARTRRFSS
jgi:hypothetical protein